MVFKLMKVKGMLKDNADNTGPRLPWAGKRVHTTNVEAELAHLWRMSADNMRTSQNINVRTSVLNLVICAPDVASAHRASLLMRELSSTHIARVILLILDPDGLPSATSTWITLRSFPIISDIMRHSFEQITVLATGTAIYDADRIIAGLLKSDLPVYVWWLHDLPTDRSILQRLSDVSSRVIVDSSSFSRPEESIRALSSLIQTLPNSALSDLNWARTAPWRELIAQFFDVSEYRPYLAGVTTISIEYAVHMEPVPGKQGLSERTRATNPIQALLLAAWLKTRLGWKLSTAYQAHEPPLAMGTYAWQMQRPSGSLTGRLPGIGKTGKLNVADSGVISLRPRVQTDSALGAVCLVRLDSVRDGQRASFSINRTDDQHVSTLVESDQGARPPHTVNVASSQNESKLLQAELEIMGRDLLYEETLHEVFDLLE
jgi:glucose-6-phosphate dehydrogenase assembly protein OpcA